MTPAAESTRERVAAVRRLFHAPRGFLFRAWTDPALFAKWFGPRGWTIDRCEVDAQAGGSWRAWFRRLDGAVVFVGGVYSKVELDRLIVFSWDTNPEGARPESLSEITVEFCDVAGGVEIRVTHRKLDSAQAVDMDVGWNSTFDSLEDFVDAEAVHRFASPSAGGREMSSPSYSGGCNCGAIRYEIAAEPVMAGHCQCRDCQRASGAGHASHMAFPKAAVKLTGKATHWDKPADSGNIVTRAFCPISGSPVYSLDSGMAHLFLIRAVSLDDPGRFQPQMAVYTASGFAWDHLDPALPRFAKMPAMSRPQ